jgi:hypothetical protein
MSTISPAAQSSSPSIRSTLAPYITPPLAASLAVIPIFYGFMAKSAEQQGQPLPPIKGSLKAGCKAAPTIGLIVGTQMVAQTLAEKSLSSLMKKTEDRENFALMLASALLVAAISAPALAVFNGQTMGKKVAESLRALSPKQALAIIARETSFLFSLRVSGPISAQMQNALGENRCVDYSSTFATGAIGSLIGHPADTLLTLWQKGMKVANPFQTMKGAPIKAVTVGGFSIGYKAVNEFLNRNIS